MKTLIIFASPRKNGQTMQMVNLFREHLVGEVELIDCYDEKDIAPCRDCRYCREAKVCAIQDGMQAIYKKINAADNIVLASPIYFYTITAPMKAIIDRCQVYWSVGTKGEGSLPRKKGIILLVGGAPTFFDQFLGGELVLKSFMREINAEFFGEVTMPNSDKVSLSDCPEIELQIISLSKMLSK